MDLQQFLSRPSGSFSRDFNSRHFNQDLSNEVRELARLGLKFFPVSLAAKLAGDSDRRIADATDDISLLEDLSTAPLWGYRLALGPSGLCVLILDGAAGRASFAALVPDLEGCLTLQVRRGDVVYVFFRQPAGMKRIASARKLAPGVSILGEGVGFDVPPVGGAVWLNPGAEIEALPYVLRQLLASDPPDSPPGRAKPAPKPTLTRPIPCRSTASIPRFDKAPRRGYPICGRADWRGGYRISRRR
jgi:hypothetical protein